VAWDSQPAYLLDAPDPAGDPCPLLLARETRAEMRAAVGRALAGLSPADRELLRLFYFEEHSYLEISALLSITPSQVRGRLHRVRGRVKAALEALEWVPSGVMK
jgi:RNA polymerase sigma-70 factor (ECF subfamily)